ncbi:MAG: hypothetical protein PHE25_06350 [Candidatus Gracilibacteria bacterium]|nr:hypothetical protein [Candidatus Gracilibacteria bacterium]
MKPNKSVVYCNNCERRKILFETEKKAENFMKFNNDEIESKSGYSPQRSYYCVFCMGWHITSIKENIGLSKKEKIIEEFNQQKDLKKVVHQDIRTEKINELENKIKEMEDFQKEKFFSDNINNINDEIKILLNNDNIDEQKLKVLRFNLDILCVVRKKTGFKPPNKQEKKREQEIEEWRLWCEKNGY